MNAKWLREKKTQYYGKEVSDEDTEDAGFFGFLIQEASKDRILLSIKDSYYQYTPIGKTLHLEMDISGSKEESEEEFDIFILEFFTTMKEAMEFVAKHNLNVRRKHETIQQ